MKKLMILAAVACCAAFANAAAIDWTAKNWVDAKGTVYTSATAPAGQFYLCYLADGTYDSAVTVGDGVSATFKESKGTVTASVTGKFTVDPNTYKNGDVFAVMFKDGDNKLNQIVTKADGAAIPLYTVAKLSDETSTLDAYTFASGNFMVQSVPEPTSGLLLLLGVAGMALRRRRA